MASEQTYSNYDINSQAPATNTQMEDYDAYYGFGTVTQSLSGIPFNESIKEMEGILSGGLTDEGESGFYTSRNYIRTLDLVCEGPIEGLVSGEDKFVGDAYSTGWHTHNFNSWGSEPENWLKSIYYNEVPVVGDTDLYNFQQISVSFTNGTPQGVRESDSFINSLNVTETQKTRTINERLIGPDLFEKSGKIEKKFYPKYYKFFNKNAAKLHIHIKIPALRYTKFGESWPSDEQGDAIGTSITIGVRHRPVYEGGDTGDWKTNLGVSLEGLLSSPYVHKFICNLRDTDIASTKTLIGWEVEIVRTTLDSIDNFVQNQSFIDTITEVFESKLSYPNSALISSYFNAEFFGQIPNRSFDLKLLKVKIPQNYDPIKKTYNGSWNGDWKVDPLTGEDKFWTDNPAWVFQDLITNKRYGLGRYIKEANIDKWTLYKIAQYCDVLVSDGEGGLEPRFACNVYLNSKDEAYKVLQDFASIFRGIVYYGLGDIHAVQDREKDVILQFNNASVLDGNFTYSGSAKKTRYTVAVVRYNDKENFYKPALEYIEDVDAIRKYGIRETEVTAFGCTSKGQAIRLGRWIMHTNNVEQDTISFKTGLEALILRPGDLIQIGDKNRGLTLQGGRVHSISNTGVILDRPIDFGDHVYSLDITTPTYFYDNSHEGLDSLSIDDIRRSHIQRVKFTTNNPTEHPISKVLIGSGADGLISGSVIGFPDGTLDAENYNVTGEAAWILDDNQYEPEYYNIVDIKESNEIEYEIQGVKHFTGKYLYIESGILTAPKDPTSPVGAQPPPAAVSVVGTTDSLSPNSKKIVLTITKPDESALGSTSSYAIYLKTGAQWDPTSFDATDGDFQQGTDPILPRDNLKITNVSHISNTDYVTMEHVPRYNNTKYYALVYAVNDFGMYSASYVKTEQAIDVTDHYPIRDVDIHSLRLIDDVSSNAPSQKKLFVINPKTRNQIFVWNATYLSAAVPNIPVEYVITIRKPSSNNNPLEGNDNILSAPEGFIETEKRFDFPFEKNLDKTTDGPHRHYDIVVEARDPVNGGKSTDGNGNGYDILEIHNLRPSGYWITPRNMYGERPDSCEANNLICSAQQITADGKIEFLLRGNAFSDLAGGNLYLSASGFDYTDFTSEDNSELGGLTGTPNNVARTMNSSPEDVPYRTIMKVPFETGPNDTLSTPFYVTPNLIDGIPISANYQQKYHLAVSFYDSFDKARKDADPPIESYNDGQWVGFQRPYTGQALDSEGYNNIKNADGQYWDNDDVLAGNAKSVTSRFKVKPDGSDSVPPLNWTGFVSCPIFPSRYYSAKAANAFHAWVRINVNGMWEGNGVEMVRVMSTEDILRYYGWPGYYEYTCEMWEDASTGYPTKYYPNSAGSMCRFTQTRAKSTNHTVNVSEWGDQNVWGKEGGDFGPDYDDDTVDAILTGKWVGVPLSWTNTEYQTEYYMLDEEEWPDDTFELVPSYNETGKAIYSPDNTEQLTRPLHGFRRFRVYLDRNNLPPPNNENKLASYSIVGMNAWNGKYDSFQGRTADDIFFAREGNYMFPEYTVGSWMKQGDIFENLPGVWNHHSAGFGQGFGGLIKTQKFFDIHMGRLIDDSYLQEGFFGVVTNNDYGIQRQFADYDKTGGDGPDPDVAVEKLGHMMAMDQSQYVWYFDQDVPGYTPEGGFASADDWDSLLH